MDDEDTNDQLELITPEDLADLLKVSKDWLYARARDGELPAFRFGRSVRFRRSDVEAWLKTQAVNR